MRAQWLALQRKEAYVLGGGREATPNVSHKCCSLATRPPKGGTPEEFLDQWMVTGVFLVCRIPSRERQGIGERCAVWLLTATGIFCLMRQPRCRPEFTIVTTENQCSLSITLMETNRNLLFKTDSILICLESGLEGKREVYSKKFPFNLYKNSSTFFSNTKLARKCWFSIRNSVDYYLRGYSESTIRVHIQASVTYSELLWQEEQTALQ